MEAYDCHQVVISSYIALAIGDMEYLSERRDRTMNPESILLTLPGGYQLRSAEDTQMFGAYVRFCDQDGRQLKRWSAQDFARERRESWSHF